MSWASTAFLLVFVALSAVDGVWLHLVRYRLHAHPASWPEHVWHTVRALLFVPMLPAVFGAQTGGALLYTGLAIVAIDQMAELLDMLGEKTSRAPLGGLSSFEYVLHVALTTARSAAIALSLAARPAAAWALDAPSVVAKLPEPLATIVHGLVPGAVAVAVVHVVLAWRHAPARAGAVRA